MRNLGEARNRYEKAFDRASHVGGMAYAHNCVIPRRVRLIKKIAAAKLRWRRERDNLRAMLKSAGIEPHGFMAVIYRRPPRRRKSCRLRK